MGKKPSADDEAEKGDDAEAAFDPKAFAVETEREYIRIRDEVLPELEKNHDDKPNLAKAARVRGQVRRVEAIRAIRCKDDPPFKAWLDAVHAEISGAAPAGSSHEYEFSTTYEQVAYDTETKWNGWTSEVDFNDPSWTDTNLPKTELPLAQYDADGTIIGDVDDGYYANPPKKGSA